MALAGGVREAEAAVACPFGLAPDSRTKIRPVVWEEIFMSWKLPGGKELEAACKELGVSLKEWGGGEATLQERYIAALSARRQDRWFRVVLAALSRFRGQRCRVVDCCSPAPPDLSVFCP